MITHQAFIRFKHWLNEQTDQARAAVDAGNATEAQQAHLDTLDEVGKRLHQAENDRQPDPSRPLWQNWEALVALQAILYAIAPGPFIGRAAAQRPCSFRLDDRARGGRLFTADDFEKVQAALAATAESLGLGADDLPPLPDFHHCDIF